MQPDVTRRAVILGGARTPFGKLNGALSSLSAVELGTVAARAAIERAGISASDIEDTIFGQVLQGGAGQNPARQVALKAGIGVEIPAETINRVCGSGMRAAYASRDTDPRRRLRGHPRWRHGEHVATRRTSCATLAPATAWATACSKT